MDRADLLADPFPRRTATIGGLVPWLAELARTAPGLVASYVPGAAIDARTRERVMLAVTEVNGCRYCAWIHGSWQEFLGDVASADPHDALLVYARASADAGRPLDAGRLRDLFSARAVRAVRATVAQIEVSNLVGNTVDGLLARLTRKRPWQPARVAEEAMAVAAAVPIAVPLLGLAAAMRTIERVAPPCPEVDMPDKGEANLLVHLLAEALPTWLGNAGLRLALLRLPAPLVIGVRAGRTAATVRVGRGRLALENGIARDALLVVEGDVEPLLRVASGAMLDEVARLRVRRH